MYAKHMYSVNIIITNMCIIITMYYEHNNVVYANAVVYEY